jgi:hypothetical protein
MLKSEHHHFATQVNEWITTLEPSKNKSGASDEKQ